MNKIKKILFIWVFILFILPTSCTLGPKYTPPVVETPEEWKNAPSQEEPICEEAPPFDYWWEIFQDETLNQLENEALANNPNLAAAMERIFEARANAGVTKSDLYPHINLAPTFTDTGQLFKIYLPNVASNVATAVNPFQNFPTVYRIHQMQYGLLANMSYELDLWGKLSGRYTSANLGMQAQIEAYHTSLLTLTTDLASYYFQLRALDAQINLYQDTINLRRSAYQLAENRYRNGIVTYTDIAEASLELTNAESDYYEIARQRALQENQIALLIGKPASLFHLDSTPLREPPPDVPIGMPSEVLLQRPDIAQAERQMAAQHAQIGVAYASFFPSLTLTGSIGFQSPDFHQFLDWKSRFWQMAASAFQTVLDGDKNKWNLELAKSSFNETADIYKQQVLIAFKEVEDALKNLEMQTKQSGSLQLSTRSARQAADLSTRRYLAGTVDYLDVVNNERSVLTAESAYITTLSNRYVSTIQLIKALGGCW